MSVVVTKGMIRFADKVVLEVDAEKRALSARNHSATHLASKSTSYSAWEVM